ncbi:dihydrofolate reductase family protein [Pseudonocardia kongjuensis]|uniref:Dihydrofolate reductase family protein n=1 Tax=Pseudonocardia kongjuensis TaxID=102227 RepID=A0ABP4IV96_9PSEU
MSDAGKVVVNRAMSLDGFIAGPGDAMERIVGYGTQFSFPEVEQATGAMLVGRRTYEVGRRMSTGDAAAYDGGPVFVLTHRPPDEPDRTVTFLHGDLAEAVDTAGAAAGGKSLEILGADLAAQCLQRGLVDEILVYVLPLLLGDGVRFSAPGLDPVELEPLGSSRSGPVTMLRYRVRR